MTRRLRTLAPVPLTVSPRQGSLPGRDETRTGNTTGRSLLPIARVALSDDVRGSGRRAEGALPARRAAPSAGGVPPAQSLEPGWSVGWNDEYPERPGRGAQDTHEQPKEPAIKLAVSRSRHNGTYYLEMTLIPRDSEVRDAIDGHWLCCVCTYLDTETRRAWESKRNALIDEKRSGYAEDGVTYFLSPGWLWVTAKQIFHSSRDTGLEVTVNDLLHTQHCWSSDLEDIREIERSVLFSVDKIAMSVEVGMSFDNQESAVYAPGSKPRTTTKRDDPTPPGDWGDE